MSGITHHRSLITHSVRNDFTGFATAAFIAWKLIVINAIANATIVVITKTIQFILIR
jgi:hypothetical protein